MPIATIEQVESIIRELKRKKMSNEEIFCFMVKTGEIPGKDWTEKITLDMLYYQALMRKLIEHVT